ncbi:adenosylcobinamide-GDP ribazoletransferase [Methanolapillus millepedarum]|uniref:Adenosylcobinamide-GDP ribazoletransferase n=1 Tax=Methanolapillus millepedarum TaxID=3028296 RepID=A0AA96V552_9EURY|nr:Adenosylcobinamide-GDP ribazoletransferase [Methanosarcinaceae archaeon Ac7]
MTLWSALKAGFGFLSILPVGITMEGIEELMNRLYFYPVTGFLLGILIGIGAFVFELILPSPLSVMAVILAIYGLTWFNHLDGIADMGDGMTAHGSLEKKRKALKDMALGIGGVASTVLLILSLYASVSALESAAQLFGAFAAESNIYIFGLLSVLTDLLSKTGGNAALIAAVSAALTVALTAVVAETLSKQSMLTIAAFGKPFSEGLGSMTIKGGTKKNLTIGIVFSTIVSVLLLGLLGFLCVIVTTLAAGVILRTSKRHFEGLNGDGIGTANEVGRMLSFATVATAIWILGGAVAWML